MYSVRPARSSRYLGDDTEDIMQLCCIDYVLLPVVIKLTLTCKIGGVSLECCNIAGYFSVNLHLTPPPSHAPKESDSDEPFCDCKQFHTIHTISIIKFSPSHLI